MSDHLDRVHLQEMLTATRHIASWMKATTLEAFVADDQLRSAVAMQFIVIGEGARLLSPEIKAKAQEIPWPAIVNMRHRLAHGYGRASIITLHDTARNQAPLLSKALHRLLDGLRPEEP